MAEYIDRERAIEKMEIGKLTCHTLANYAVLDIIVETLKRFPAADVASVVRCRECKHLNVVNDEKLYAHCPKTNTVFLPFQLDTRTHFCSLGERR